MRAYEVSFIVTVRGPDNEQQVEVSFDVEAESALEAGMRLGNALTVLAAACPVPPPAPTEEDDKEKQK